MAASKDNPSLVTRYVPAAPSLVGSEQNIGFGISKLAVSVQKLPLEIAHLRSEAVALVGDGPNGIGLGIPPVLFEVVGDPSEPYGARIGQLGGLCLNFSRMERKGHYGETRLMRSDQGDGGWSLHAPEDTDDEDAIRKLTLTGTRVAVRRSAHPCCYRSGLVQAAGA